MSEADLYCDVMFTNSRERIIDNASLNETTYSEVKISKLQPFTEQSVASQQVMSNRGSKVTTERVSLLVFGVLLIAAVIGLAVVSFYYLKTKDDLQRLQKHYDTIKANLTAIPGKNAQCPKCERCWELHGGKCYYFSLNASSWQQSRDDCESRGGDLVKIDSREEQKFLDETVRNKMMHGRDSFWIGLTDSVEEDKWVWVDGSPLSTSLTFWSPGQPTNWAGQNPNEEDCVMMGEKREVLDLSRWHDRPCDIELRRICEKSAETGL
ncbi:hepatic lectin-like [Channa argus]|uniref:hepatic lectin-like n=1 Tax=Channa argus TaxID=215402 RepID=UPI0035200957